MCFFFPCDCHFKHDCVEATTLQPSKKDLDELLKSLSLSFPGEEEDGSSDDGDDVFGLAEAADAQLRRLKKE